ncbi:MAG TPA: hypothetical protein VH598_07510 [Verrucomicrobiae bacterium]|nr:hypothetical protein [Verrucomicrobiae bacterium]
MNPWKVILATLVIFGTGVITGGLLVTHAYNNTKPNRPSPPAARVPAVTPWQVRLQNLLHRMDAQLYLTPEQRAQIEQIISDSQERTKALWKPIAPQMGREMQHVRDEIRDALTPEQRKKFDDLTQPRPIRKLGEPDRQSRDKRDSSTNSNTP